MKNRQYIAQRSQPEKLKSDILKLSTIAKADKLSGNHVIDATIGTFLNDDKTINTVSSVIESINKYLPSNLGYPSITGYEEYKVGLLKWFLKENYDEISKNFYLPFTATIGGTGALSLAFNLFLDVNDTVLLPNIMWSNYKLIAKKAHIKHDTYQLFNEANKFNINDLCEKIVEYSKLQNNVLVVINDPCQNPTGYSLSDQEYDELIAKLNDLSQNANITIIFDIAYLDYDSNNQQMHRLFKHITSKEISFLSVFAASCSKIFGLYGSRVGALFSINKDDNFSNDFSLSLESQIRGTYSCPNGPALISLGNLLTKDFSTQIEEEIYNNTVVLNERTHYFIKLLKENNIEYLPYVNGFFVTLKVDNAYEICQTLKKEHVYVIPLSSDLIRVAVCSLNKNEIDELIVEFVKVLK